MKDHPFGNNDLSHCVYNQVELFGNEKVDLLEVITLDGKTVIRQKNPGKIVYTGSLSSGIYIFRIHTDGKAKTMKAQKIN